MTSLIIAQVQHMYGPASIDVRRIVGTITVVPDGALRCLEWHEPSGPMKLYFSDAEKAAQALTVINASRIEFAKHCV